MKRFPTISKSSQKGFTLIELGIVVAILGVLIMIMAPSLFGSTDGVKAKHLDSSAQKISNNLVMLSQTAGISTAVAGNPVIAAGYTIEDVLFLGSTAVSATYQAAYASSKVIPLSEIAQQVSSGVWAINGSTVTLSGGGTAPLSINFACVPDTVVLQMVQKYSPGTTALTPAGATVSPRFSYGAVAGGCASVSISKVVS